MDDQDRTRLIDERREQETTAVKHEAASSARESVSPLSSNHIADGLPFEDTGEESYDRFAGLDVMPPGSGDSGVSDPMPDAVDDSSADLDPLESDHTALRPASQVPITPSVGDTLTHQQPLASQAHGLRGRRTRQTGYEDEQSEDDHSRRHREPRRARHGFLSFLLWLIMLPVLALLAARMVPAEYASGRAIPELVSFVPLTLAVSAPTLLLALLWHRRFLAVVSGAALAVTLWWHVGFFVPSGQLSATAQTTVATTRSTDDGVVRIMTLNTDNGGASAAEVVAAVTSNNVEVLALQEVSESFLSELANAGIYDLLPYSVTSVSSANDNGGVNVLFTLAPMGDVSTDLVPTIMSKMCAGSIDAGGTTLRFVSAHPNSPHSGGEDLWSEGLESIAGLSDYDHVYVICGDFNSTWDHARFRELLGTSFVDAGEQAGELFHMTFPNMNRIPALIEIDHVVYSADAGVFVGDLATLDISGSDHRALLATLEVQG